MRAAIRYKGTVYSVPRPGRHHHVVLLMAMRGLGPETMHDQGFVTNKGRYVDRQEGVVIARNAGQIIKKTSPDNYLFSEDVW